MPWYKKRALDFLPLPNDLDLSPVPQPPQPHQLGAVSDESSSNSFPLDHQTSNHPPPVSHVPQLPPPLPHRSEPFAYEQTSPSTSPRREPVSALYAPPESTTFPQELSPDQVDAQCYAAHHEAEVWQIKTTGEIFTNYEYVCPTFCILGLLLTCFSPQSDYLVRVSFLRKKQFTCAKTGRNNLSYEEALVSEQEATRRVEDAFPAVWRVPAIRFIHYSLSKLNALVEDLYDHFAGHLFLHEFIYINVGGVLALAKILEAMPGELTKPLMRPFGPWPTEDGDTLYRVNLVDNDRNLLTLQDLEGTIPVEYVLPVAQLKRDRTILAKQNFKKFIRDVATRDVWQGAPWIVKAEQLAKFGIPDKVPPHVKEVFEERHRKLTGEPDPVKKEKPPSKAQLRKAAKAAAAAAAAAAVPPLPASPAIEGDVVEKVPRRKGRPPKLPVAKEAKAPKEPKEPKAPKGPKEQAEVVSVPAKPPKAKTKPKPKPKPKLKRKPKPKPKPKPLVFPMDDLEVVELAPPQFDPSIEPVPTEPHLTTHFGAVPTAQVKDVLQVANFLYVFGRPLRIFPFPFDDLVTGLSDHHHTSPLVSETFSCLLHISCREYAVKADADPDLPVPRETAHATTGETDGYDEATRVAMRAYADLYEGFTYDEQVAIDQWWKWAPRRWTRGEVVQSAKLGPDVRRLKAWEVVLAGLIRDVAKVDSLKDKWTLLVKLLGRNPYEEVRVTVDDKNGDDDDEEEVEEEDAAPHTVDRLGESELENDDTSPPPPRSRKRNRTDVLSDDDEAEFVVEEEEDDDDDIPLSAPSRRVNNNSTSTRSTASLHSSKLQLQSNNRPTSKKQRKTKPRLAFDHLMQITQRSFSALLTPSERLSILTFLVRHCVSPSTRIREYVDDALEKGTELRREKREIAKERRERRLAVVEIDRKERLEAAIAELEEDRRKEEGEKARRKETGEDPDLDDADETGVPASPRLEDESGGEDEDGRESDAQRAASAASDTMSLQDHAPSSPKGSPFQERRVSLDSEAHEDEGNKTDSDASQSSIGDDLANTLEVDSGQPMDVDVAPEKSEESLQDNDLGAHSSNGESSSSDDDHPLPSQATITIITRRRRHHRSKADSPLPHNPNPRTQKLQAERDRISQAEQLRLATTSARREALKRTRERTIERKRLHIQLDQLEVRDRSVDDHLTSLAACLRMGPLGLDRWHNRYWSFDRHVVPPPVVLPSNVKRVASVVPDPPQPHRGRIYVEMSGLQDAGDLLSREERQVVEQGLTDGAWGYYENGQIEEVVRRLDRRGHRELALAEALDESVARNMDADGRRGMDEGEDEEVEGGGRGYVNWWGVS
ncbi:hypothetical protein HKX48_002078 [Thoreauomyces humboldtii]|nr:hypothetical protein HKX48_002078 [Thoreauomyces humboldtii]